jgi:hypothetical protein
MRNTPLVESVVSVILLILGVLLLNPFEFWMPDMVLYCAVAIVLVAFGVLGVFVLREGGVDEREVHERSSAGRYAYLVGAGFLLAGILYQGWSHSVDPWLVIALGAMLATKLVTRFFNDLPLQ